MSDTGRKDFSDSTSPYPCDVRDVALEADPSSPAELGDKMTPNQSKSTTDSVKDTVTGMGDKVARFVPPPVPLPILPAA